MNTYPEMNGKIVELLKVDGSPLTTYAADRIQELESALREIQEHCAGNWFSVSIIAEIARKALESK